MGTLSEALNMPVKIAAFTSISGGLINYLTKYNFGVEANVKSVFKSFLLITAGTFIVVTIHNANATIEAYLRL